MKKVLIDTDVLIDFTKGKNDLLNSLLEMQSMGSMELYITPVTIVEFMNDQSLKTPEKLNKAKEFLRSFSVFDIGSSVGYTAGGYLRNGHIQFLGDALIAAACMTGELMLSTRNRRHFSRVPGLAFYEEEN